MNAPQGPAAPASGIPPHPALRRHSIGEAPTEPGSLLRPLPQGERENGIPTFEELAADPEIAALLDFEPVPRQVSRPNGWTPDRQREFIARLAHFGSPKLATDSMGKNVSGVTPLYKQKGSESFRAAWDGALALHASRQPPDDGTAFLGQVPGMGLRWAENRLQDPPDPPPGQVLNEFGEWEDEGIAPPPR